MLNPKIQNPEIEIGISELIHILKSKKDFSTALNMAVQINEEAGEAIISTYDLTVIREHYRNKKARDIRREMVAGYMKWMNEKTYE